MNNLDSEKIQALSQDMFTCSFRCIDLLFSSKRKHKAHIVYSGCDPSGNRFDPFYEKICKALDLLLDQACPNILIYSVLPKRIIGSVAPTRIWRFPRSLEINYDRVFSVPDLFLAGEILYEGLKFHYSKTTNSSTARNKARQDEYFYVKRISGEKFNEELFSKFRSSRPMTEDQVSSELRKTIGRIKTKTPPRGAEGSSGSEESNS